MNLSRKILDSVLELAADEVFLLNPDGSLQYVNRSTLARRGFSLDEMLNMAVWDWNVFVTETSWKKRWESLKQIKSARFETRHLDKSGESFPVDVQAHYLFLNDQEYCICFVNDLSEIAEKVNELDKRHKELAVAKARADEALQSLKNLQERSRSLLFATIAHELRTPISAISMLSSDDSAESWLDARNQVHQLARDLLHTLDDMRRLTQDNHTREVTSEQFNLQNLLESVQLSVSAYISRYRMNIQVSYFNNDNPSEIWLYGDLYRLKIVLSNLVKNACVHSGGDEINIGVSCVDTASGDQQLTFTVTDNGRGIPPDQVDQLFSPYYRGTTDADGSGLGLHIARSWIEELGGTLHSIPSDIGAVFELMVTVKSASRQSGGGRDSGSPEIESPRAYIDTSQLSVLFVEDDTIIQMVGKKLLSKMFATVDVASDGAQALNQLQQNNYDVVLTDYFMPNMNGLELISELRSTGYDGVLYACTAASLGTELNDLVNAGANDVFTKPLTLNKLMACLVNDADLFQRVKQPVTDGMKEMKNTYKTLSELIEKSGDKALLLIDLESGEIQGTEKWRKLNAVPNHEPLTRTLLNQTIPEKSRDEYVRYSKQFFQSPVSSAPVVLEIKLCGLDGREFMGRVTSEKVVVDNRVFAFTEVEEI